METYLLGVAMKKLVSFPGRGDTPYSGLDGEAPPERGGGNGG